MSERFLKPEDLTPEKIKYINVKNHSENSIMMGLGNAKKHIKTCYKKGHLGTVFTDNGTMMGNLDLYNQARDKKVLESIGYEGKMFPIIMGSALFVTHCTDLSLKDEENKYTGATFLIKNQAGYENLAMLVSIGSVTERFYSKPRISFSDIFKHKNNVICMSGGFNGFISSSIMNRGGLLKDILIRIVKDQSKIDAIKYNLDIERESAERAFSVAKNLNLIEDQSDFITQWLLQNDNYTFFEKFIATEELQNLLVQNENSFPIQDEIFLTIGKTEKFNYLTQEEKIVFIRLLTDFKPAVYVNKFKKEFGDDFYLEINPNDLTMQWNSEEKMHIALDENPQEKVNRELVRLSEECGAKLVLVQDSFIPDGSDHIIQSIQIWNSPGNKNQWYMYEPLEIMDIPTMYEKLITVYPWVSDHQFLDWCAASVEILDKCKDCDLQFKPSLPQINYEDHYVNKVPTIVRRSLMLDLQELKLWNEALKSRIILHKSIQQEETIPESIKSKYALESDVIDFEDMELRVKENIFLENNLKKIKTFYKKEKAFAKLIERSETDIAMRTALKVMMRNRKLLPQSIDYDKLNLEVAKKMPGKTVADFKPDVIEKFIVKHSLYKQSEDPMLMLGDAVVRDRLVEESNTMQYNGILRLMNYFMLLEDVTSFINENGYLRGFGRGCLHGDTLVLTPDRGYVKIKDLVAGDSVFTHTGQIKKIFKTLSYAVKEKGYEIEATNSIHKLVLTQDHKVYGVIREHNEEYLKAAESRKHKVKKYADFIHNPEFYEAKKYKEGDLIFSTMPLKRDNNFYPKINIKGFDYDLNEMFAFLVGKFIKDGSFIEKKKQLVGINLSFNNFETIDLGNLKEFLVEKEIKFAEKIGTNTKLEIESIDLVKFFENNLPEFNPKNVKTKYLGNFKYIQKTLLRCLMFGLLGRKSNFDTSTTQGSCIDTSSVSLQMDVREALLYLNIPSSFVSRMASNNEMAYKVKFSGLFQTREKLDELIQEDGCYLKIKTITEVDLDCVVYDLMISDDSSFLTGSGIVHNSGAGSIVAYALDITDCNPLEYTLLFERFLTKERIGEINYEIDGFPLKDFFKQPVIEISKEDLSLDEFDEESFETETDDTNIDEEV